MMSQPHFYEGPRYSAAIEGMHPDKEEHQTVFDVEPVSDGRMWSEFIIYCLLDYLVPFFIILLLRIS